MAQNMYRVGDFVYFDVGPNSPYVIRKIEELGKNVNGQVEAKVSIFMRRRDMHSRFLMITDEAARKKDDDDSKPKTNGESNGKAEENGVHDEKEGGKISLSKEECDTHLGDFGPGGLPNEYEKLDDDARNRLRQRELFTTRINETLLATAIRGRCSVTLLSSVENCEMYDNDDLFYFSLLYDGSEKTLLADKGHVRVGSKYQAVVPEGMEDDEEEKPKKEPKEELDESNENGELMIDEDEEEKKEEGAEVPSGSGTEKKSEVLVYHPNHGLSDRDIDQFLIIARAVGTFSRALDTSSSTKLPSLHMTAAAASRDVTLLHAMALLHQADYDIGKAVKFLVPPPNKEHYPLEADKSTSHKTVSLGGPILCRDQIEEWSPAEANLFEEALDKYGKDFTDVRQEYLPWKSMKDIVEYYYMWKTTNRYIDHKRKHGSAEGQAEGKLKQVYIPTYNNKPNPCIIGQPNTSGQPVNSTAPCASCDSTLSMQWYEWGPREEALRVCADCWIHWKKYAGLKKMSVHEKFDMEAKPHEVAPGRSANTIEPNANRMLINGVAQSSSINAAGPAGRSNLLPPTAAAPKPPGAPSARSAAAGAMASAKLNPSDTRRVHMNRLAFLLRTDILSRVARKLALKTAGGPFNMRKSCRQPFLPIDQAAIRGYCNGLLPEAVARTSAEILKIPPMSLPPTMIQAIGTHTLFPAPTGKRPATTNGTSTPGEPAAKKPSGLAQGSGNN